MPVPDRLDIESDTMVTRGLAAAGLTARRHAVTPIGGGIDNLVFAAESTDGRQLIVKIRRRSRRARYDVAAWAARQLATAGVPTPRILWHDQDICVETRCPGRPLASADDMGSERDLAAAAAAGELLRRQLHAVPVRGFGRPSVSMPFPRVPRYGPAERQAVLTLLERGRLSETGCGPATTELEDAFAEMVGTTHALSFNSGTAALHAALHAVGANDHAGVAVSPMTWISAITAVFHAGSFPIFCDIEADSPNLAPSSVTDATDDCSAVLVTHAWGIPARMDALAAATHRPIVEDCSHAHGAAYAGQTVGSWGAAGCFSLQETKAVSGGEGGILTTSDRYVYEHALTLGHHPHRLRAELTLPELLAVVETGAAYKYRMPALAAVIAREQLRGLRQRMAAAEANLETLLQVVQVHDLPIVFPAVGDGSVRGWYGTPLIVTDPVGAPAALLDACVTEGLPLRALYPDWLRTPLLQRPDLLHRFWPHLRSTPYLPPDPEAFGNYYRARRQMLVLKVPLIAAPDYMEQVGAGLTKILTRVPFRA